MILKGNEDLRVVKTIEGIKRAFEGLICEKDYGKITVKELCGRAPLPVNNGLSGKEVYDILTAASDRLTGLGIYEYAPSGNRNALAEKLIRFGAAL